MDTKLKSFHGSDFEYKDLQPAPHLQEGRILPKPLAALFDDNLVRTPIEEIDQFYNIEKTFVIINDKNKIFRFNSDRSFGIFSPLNPIRRTALAITTHRFFSAFIFMIIAIHAVVMMMPASQVPHSLEIFFTAIYTLEMVIKITARGFVKGKFTYLRDPWNWLDFVLLTAAFLTVHIYTGNFAYWRTWKSLRILRLLRVELPGLNIIVAAIFTSLKNLRIVAALILFFLFLFSVIGVQFYMGVLTQKCIKNYPVEFSEVTNTDTSSEREMKVKAHNSNITNWLEDPSGQFRFCGYYEQCLDGYTCLIGYGINPDYNYTSFDSFGWAFLSSFRITTQDYWEALYQQILVTAGRKHFVFFALIIFFGSFYLINLIISTVIMTLNEISDKLNNEHVKCDASSAPLSNGAEIDSQTTESIPFIDESPLATSRTGIEIVDMNPTPTSTLYIFSKEATNINGETHSPNAKDDAGWCSRCFHLVTVWDCGFPWRNVQKGIAFIVTDPFFELLIAAIVIINTIFLALDHYGLRQKSEMMKTLKIGNYVFSLIFFMEAVLKIFAMNPKYYFRIAWNRYDFIVVVFSVMELCFEDPNLPGISALRAFRLLRIFRLAKYWPAALLEIFKRAVGVLGNLLFAFLIITGTFGILGCLLYAKNYIDSEQRFPSNELPRWNFIDFWHSWMVVFRALCGEWIETMWDCMYIGDASCVPFFLAVVIIGSFLIIPLCLALVLRATYEVSTLYDNPTAIEPSKIQQAFQRIRYGLNWIFRCNERTQVMDEPTKSASANPLEAKFKSTSLESMDGSAKQKRDVDGSGFRYGLCLFIESKYFDLAVMIMLLVSCIALTLEDIHFKESPRLESALDSLDLTFTILFLVEAMVKLIGFGFKKYFTSAWCRFEFFIVMVTVFNVSMGFIGLGTVGFFKSMRSIRAIRFLMFFSRISTMKVLLQTLSDVIWPILNVVPGVLLFWLIFAILGVQLFNGKFYKCIDLDGNKPEYRIITNQIECLTHNFTWTNSPINFDHVGHSFLALFQVATFKGWISIMNNAIDSRQLDEQPAREVNFVLYFFFVIFVIFGAFLTRSILWSIVIMKYLKSVEVSTEAEYENSIKVAKERMSKVVKIPPPNCNPTSYTYICQYHKWRPQSMLFKLVTHWKFEAFFMLFICLNILVMSMDHYQQSKAWEDVMAYLGGIFMAIFVAEAVIKIFALRYHYFRVPWNLFDFFVVALSILSLVQSDLIVKYFVSPTLVRFIRIARIGRVISPFKWSKGIRTLLSTLNMSLPSLFAIVIILFILMFIYSIFGMGFFLNVKLEGGLGEIVNFREFEPAMNLMFQISTAAGWDGILESLSSEVDCDVPDPEFEKPGNCGSPILGIVLMVSFVVICWYILSGIILAIIFANYSKAKRIANDKELTDEDFDKYYKTWGEFIPDGSNYIQIQELSEFLDALDQPLRISKPNKYKIVHLDIPICKEGRIHMADILEALIENFFVSRRGLVAPQDGERQVHGSEAISSTRLRNREENSARVIQTCWRKYKQRGPMADPDPETEADDSATAEDAPHTVVTPEVNEE